MASRILTVPSGSHSDANLRALVVAPENGQTNETVFCIFTTLEKTTVTKTFLKERKLKMALMYSSSNFSHRVQTKFNDLAFVLNLLLNKWP